MPYFYFNESKLKLNFVDKCNGIGLKINIKYKYFHAFINFIETFLHKYILFIWLLLNFLVKLIFFLF